MKVSTMFVIGKRDMEAGAVSVRVHGKGNLDVKPRGEAIAEILQSIKERRPIVFNCVLYFVSAGRFCFRLARIPAARCESGSALAD
jgi:hypothetical protein